MFERIIFIIPLLWLMTTTIDALEYVHVWQIKEYRIDRMRDFFRSVKGKAYVRSYSVMLRILFFSGLSFLLVPTHASLTNFLYVLVGIDTMTHALRILRRKGIIRPVPTLKARLLVFLYVLIEGAALFFFSASSLGGLMIIFRFFFASLLIVLVQYPTLVAKRWYIHRAKKKLASYKQLTVIGVTGSYGKSSVKTYLGQMLSASKEIITTPKNINTEIGIAKFILATDFSDKDIFVVEMGAYRVGEIELICNMCQPTIGILTAINETHLSLFGSIKHTQQAKYELLRSLPREGLAITNMDNQYCRELLDTLHCHVETFGCDDEFNPTLMVTDITHKKGLLSATYCRNTDNACIRTQTKTPGLHNALNIAPCLLVGAHLGVSLDDMTTAINERLQNPQKVLSIYEAGKATIIDDSYNANPDGFKAALTVLGSYPSTVRKVVITRGMLELGEQSDEIHTRIAEEISFFADELIITHPDAAQSLKQGLIKKYKQTSARTVYHPEKLLWEVGELLQERSVLLIENQIPSVVYQFIQSKRQSDEDPA